MLRSVSEEEEEAVAERCSVFRKAWKRMRCLVLLGRGERWGCPEEFVLHVVRGAPGLGGEVVEGLSTHASENFVFSSGLLVGFSLRRGWRAAGRFVKVLGTGVAASPA